MKTSVQMVRDEERELEWLLKPKYNFINIWFNGKQTKGKL